MVKESLSIPTSMSSNTMLRHNNTIKFFADNVTRKPNVLTLNPRMVIYVNFTHTSYLEGGNTVYTDYIVS
jgi:hypothetical protein